MQSTANTETDRAFEVESEIRHTIPRRLESVAPLPNSRLSVTFVDGTSGEVNMGQFLGSSTVDGTVFESLRDPELFARAQIVLGAIQWPNGADLSPDAMYDAILENGVWVVD